MKTVPLCAAIVLLLVALAGPLAANAAAQMPTIMQLKDGVFQVQDGERGTVFLVTSAGILIVDPLGSETARWLAMTLNTRFPGVPVRYVVLTDHDVFRAGGGATFRTTARVVSQKDFNAERDRAAHQLPPSLTTLDTNRNGALESGEFATSPYASLIRSWDLDRNGSVTSAELYGGVPVPDDTFERTYAITVGDQRVDLRWIPTSRVPEMAIVVFPQQRVAYAPDLVPAQSVPEQIGPEGVRARIRSLLMAEQLPFDTLVTGSGTVVTRNDVVEFREYLQDLDRGVRAGIEAGLSVAEVQTSLPLDKYSHWMNFTMGTRENIAEVYTQVSTSELRLFAGPAFTASNNPCAISDCVSEGHISAAPVGGVQLHRRHVVLGGHVAIHPASTGRYPSFRSSFTKKSDTVYAFDVGYATTSRSGRMRVVVHGGPAVFRATLTGTGLGGSVVQTFHEILIGWSVGTLIEMPVSSKVGVGIPVRVMHASGTGYYKSRTHIDVGAGLTIRLARGI